MRFQSIRVCSVVAASVLILGQPHWTFAQEDGDKKFSQAVCMASTSAAGEVLSIFAPKESAKTLRAKGFKREPCSKSFDLQDQRDAYRDTVCHMASTWREEQHANFEATYGERPAVLCGMAEVAIGQWRVRSKR